MQAVDKGSGSSMLPKQDADLRASEQRLVYMRERAVRGGKTFSRCLFSASSHSKVSQQTPACLPPRRGR